jgi:N-acyl-D-amino-acid deacylase
LPEWVYQGGTAEELNRLADPGLREKIKKGVTWEDWEAVVISLVSTEANKVFEGRRLTEITAEKNLSPPDCLIELLREEGAKVEALFFSLSPENLERVLGRPYCMVGSDGSAKADYGPLSRGKPHPRSFGTFPRFLHRSAGRGALSWEKAVHRITGLPAEKLGLSDRGAIKEGAAADLVVFDPERIVDRATYENPHRYPEGIEYVIVNGEVVIGKGEHTGRLPGRFLVK